MFQKQAKELETNPDTTAKSHIRTPNYTTITEFNTEATTEKMQRISDCGVLIPKRNILITPFPKMFMQLFETEDRKVARARVFSDEECYMYRT